MAKDGFKPLRQGRYSDEVLTQLKDAILTQRYKAGDKLPSERELIQSFQVSRSVVREALRGLEISGLVSIRQGATGGAYVNDLTFEHLSDACTDLFMANKLSLPELQQARLLIEPIVAKLAAENITPEAEKRIRETVEQESEQEVDYAAMVIRRSRLHYVLAEMSGNRFLEAIIKSLTILVREVVEKFEPDVDIVHPVGMHSEVINAILAGDGNRAQQAMHDHLVLFGEKLKEAETAFRSKKS